MMTDPTSTSIDPKNRLAAGSPWGGTEKASADDEPKPGTPLVGEAAPPPKKPSESRDDPGA